MNIIKPVFAQVINPIVNNSRQNTADPKAFFNKFLRGMFSMFMIIGTLYFTWHIVMATYHFISTEGDKAKFQTAKDEFLHAIIGLIVLYSIFSIIKLIGIIFSINGLDNLQISWPNLI